MKKTFSFLAAASVAFLLAGCHVPAASSSTLTSEASSSNGTSSSSTSSSPLSSSSGHAIDLDLPSAPTYNEDSVSFHYYRKDGTYKNWDMWLWEVGKDGAAFAFNAKDDWGVIASYPLSKWVDPVTNSLGFIIREGGDSWSSKDCGGSDLFLDFSLYNKDANGVYNVYLVSGDSNVYVDTAGNMKGKIKMATFATTTRIALLANLGITKYVLNCDGAVLVENDAVGGRTRVDVDLPNSTSVDFTKSYSVTLTLKNGDVLTSEVSKTLLFGTTEFSDLYNYDGSDLGAVYSSSATSFKVWSPLSTSITLRVYNVGTPASLGGDDTFIPYAMSKGDKGVFSANVEGDLAGKYYTYVVNNGTYKDKECVDPYAKGCGVNGLRGMIVDFAKTNPTGWDSVSALSIDRKALAVYETHVADITSSTTWTGTESNRKRFAGMAEAGTSYTANGTTVKTGFDHIKELGVNAVQIIPIFDQANDELNPSFNWGYNPLNYNCLEGSYSSDPKDGYARIKEFKALVQAYNAAGINIIMDVVYNHMAGATGSNFDILMPGYYFRYTDAGALSNGSGCGNETASDHAMMRKFIKDSVAFWSKEYKLGGFRFDLMGLHDLTTMNEVTAAAKAINPAICIYGEPWAGGTTTLKDAVSAKQLNGNHYVGYGQFNDQMRDGLIKGGLSGDKDLGWVTNATSAIENFDAERILNGIKGTTYAASVTIADPDKTTNYVSCHDNYTLADRIAATATAASKDVATVEKMNALANSVVLTSEGTSFLLAGEEMLRSKGGNKNSYNASYETNALDYALKIAHPDLFKNYQKLIALKENLDGLHLDATEAAKLTPSFDSTHSLLSYDLPDSANQRTYHIIHANGTLAANTNVDLNGYTLYWSSAEGAAKTLTAATTIAPYETVIAYK